MNVHIFQHVPFEGPGIMEEWLRAKGHTLHFTRFYEPETALPAHDGTDALIVMGGPMNIYEEAEHPWLANEKRFIKETLAAGKPILGICLGAQLLSDAAGGSVFPNSEKEIGLFPVRFEDSFSAWLGMAVPPEQTFFHWHGDTFHLPPAAVLQASTPACRNQLYTIGERAAGIQFHPEVTIEGIRAMYAHEKEPLPEGQYIQSLLDDMQYMDALENMHRTMRLMLEKLFTV